MCRWQRLSFLAQQLQLLCACCFSKPWAVLATGCSFSWPYLSSQGILSGLLSLRPSSSCLISGLDT